VIYSAALNQTAERERRRPPANCRTRINQALLRLELDPRPAGSTKLISSKDRGRVRAGDHRIICAIDDSTKIVSVLRAATVVKSIDDCHSQSTVGSPSSLARSHLPWNLIARPPRFAPAPAFPFFKKDWRLWRLLCI